MRESAAVKARRYLVEGRLTISYVDGNTIAATCRGDGQLYRLGHDTGRWYCSCPARTTECSHLAALRLVVLIPNPARARLASVPA